MQLSVQEEGAGVRQAVQGRVITLRVCGGVYLGALYIVLRDAHWDRAAGAVGWRGVCVCASVCAWGGVLASEPVGCAGGEEAALGVPPACLCQETLEGTQKGNRRPEGWEVTEVPALASVPGTLK